VKNKTLVVALLCGLTGPVGLSFAADPSTQIVTKPTADPVVVYPYIEGEFIWELQGDFTTSTDDPAAELNDVFGYIELAASLYLSDVLQINTVVVGEPVQDPAAGQNRFFDDHGLYVEAVNVQVNLSEYTSLMAGKFGPGFGTAWDMTPGIYGVDFAEDYELAEMLGFEVSHMFAANSLGAVTLGASVFYADTTFLSDSIITRRGRTNLADGGAGNTEEPNNFAVSLDGEELPDMPGFEWHLAYRHLSAGQGDVADEHGIVAGITQEVEFGDEQAAVFNLEYAAFDNFGGSADDVDYLTAGLTFIDGPWHTDISGTLRNRDVVAGADVDDVLFQASVGYVDENDIDWNVGYKFAEEGGVDSHTFGFFITRATEFLTK